MDPTAEILFNYLGTIIYDPAHAQLDVDCLPEGFRELGMGIKYFAESYLEASEFAKALSNGHVEVKAPPPSNEMAAALKSLHASLRHLTWQTQQVAQGDYNQRVSFMGGFADAFNSMVEQLSRRRADLINEIEAKRRETHILQDAANQDTLTKVSNRRHGMKILNEWMSDKRRFIICFVDMDNLKYVNDKFGHAEGDHYIMTVVTTLREISPDLVISRLGGDEFMLLETEWNEKQAEKRMEDVIRRLASMEDERYYRSVSYGIITVDERTDLPVGDLLAQADEKMYAYKRAHRKARQ
ncbi:MAG: diguanylate cyclase [Clostridiales bacterium]|jgi:diguanylate cyclase (GGDEF)-like protein|nr:diguanylate cyclase [Clostridiales bacterium]